MSQTRLLAASNRWRRWKVLRLSAALSCLAAFIPSTAQALPIPEDPLIADHVFEGQGWSNYRISLEPGATFHVQIQGEPSEYVMIGMGIWIFKGDGEFISNIMLSGYLVTVTETYYSVPALGAEDYQTSGRRKGSAENGISVTRGSFPAGEYIVVLGAVSDGTYLGLTSRLFGDQGVKLVSQRHGTSAFMNYEPDFDSTANVLVSRGIQAGTYGNGVRAGAMVEGSVSETVTNRLFGQFRSTHRATLINADTPSASTEPGREPLFFSGSESGEYTFNVAAAGGVSPPYSGAVWAWGLDAPLL